VTTKHEVPDLEVRDNVHGGMHFPNNLVRFMIVVAWLS